VKRRDWGVLSFVIDSVLERVRFFSRRHIPVEKQTSDENRVWSMEGSGRDLVQYETDFEEHLLFKYRQAGGVQRKYPPYRWSPILRRWECDRGPPSTVTFSRWALQRFSYLGETESPSPLRPLGNLATSLLFRLSLLGSPTPKPKSTNRSTIAEGEFVGFRNLVRHALPATANPATTQCPIKKVRPSRWPRIFFSS